MLEHPPARYPGTSLHPRASGPHEWDLPTRELSPHQHDAKPTALPDFQHTREQGKKNQTKNPTTGLEKDAREMPKLGFL